MGEIKIEVAEDLRASLISITSLSLRLNKTRLIYTTQIKLRLNENVELRGALARRPKAIDVQTQLVVLSSPIRRNASQCVASDGHFTSDGLQMYICS